MKFKLGLIEFTILCLSGIGVFALASCSNDDGAEHRNTPRYILVEESVEEGHVFGSDTNFLYYPIKNKTTGAAEYAVALTEAGKRQGSITIPSTRNGKPVTGIWRNGFAYADALTITFPEGLRVIDYEGFIGSGLKMDITIPYTVEEIGESAFYSCKNLTGIIFENGIVQTSSSPACFCDPASASDPTSAKLTKIPDFCFLNCKNVTKLSLLLQQI